MNRVLKEEVDYVFLEKNNGFGMIRTVPRLQDGQTLNRITSPRSGQKVLLEKGDRLIPVQIISGEYESGGRVSNFWHWREMHADALKNESKIGYGFFYDMPSVSEENQEIKQWYKATHPTDECGDDLRDKVTFEDLYQALKRKEDACKAMGINDSIVRERIFDKLAEIKEVPYGVIYELWLD